MVLGKIFASLYLLIYVLKVKEDWVGVGVPGTVIFMAQQINTLAYDKTNCTLCLQVQTEK